MSVRRRKDGRWRVDISVLQNGARERIKKAAPTREAALKLERELRAQLDRGEAVLQRAPLFSEWAREFIEVYAETNNKFSEQTAKRQILRDHLDPFFGELRLDKIGVAEIERFKRDQLVEKKASAKSVNNRLTVLRRMFVVAHEWGKLGSVPRVRWLKLPPRTFRFLSFEETNSLLDAAAPEWRTMILAALRTGLRIGELLALTWSDVDLVAGRLVVRRTVWRGREGTPKGGRARELPLSREARGALELLPSRERGSYVFGRGAPRLTSGEVKWPLWTACTKAGIARCGWHVLRHTFASHLVMKGVVLKAVQELLGHATMEMTMRYAHLSPDVRSDAVERLDVRSGASEVAPRY
ncbi:MAG: tyrosine-type recombinase/integrase [Patescibacteria group bacterium]